MNLKKNGIVLAFLLMLVVGIMGCATNQNTGNPPANPENNPEPNPSGNAGGNGGTASPPVKEFSIAAKKFEFTPSTITVKKGDKVIIRLSSADVAHGFSLPEFGVNQEIQPGTTPTVEFVADRAGTFQFKCSVPCGEGHQEMTGQLVVEE